MDMWCGLRHSLSQSSDKESQIVWALCQSCTSAQHGWRNRAFLLHGCCVTRNSVSFTARPECRDHNDTVRLIPSKQHLLLVRLAVRCLHIVQWRAVVGCQPHFVATFDMLCDKHRPCKRLIESCFSRDSWWLMRSYVRQLANSNAILFITLTR